MLLFRRAKSRAMTDRPAKLIRNSTAEFLIFTGESDESYSDNDVTSTLERQT
jgi:hypothetical protein